MNPADPRPVPAAASRTSVAAMLALLGCIAVLVGWFLPWMTLTDEARNALDMDREDLETIDRELQAKGESSSVRRVVKNLLGNEAVNGQDWVTILEYQVDRATATSMGAEEERAWRAATWVVRLLPWVAGLLALGILFARVRPLGAPLLGALLAFGILIGSTAGLLWIGASQHARESVEQDPAVLGMGIYATTIGGGLAVLGGLFGVRVSTWWKAWLLAALLVAGVVLGVWTYVRP